MKKRILKIVVSSLFLLVEFSFAQQVEFNLSGKNLDEIYDIPDFKLTLGLDSTATSGPELDARDVPASPPSLFVTFTGFVSFVGNDTPLIEEFKPDNLDRVVWHLKIDFGDPAQSGASDGNITLDWGTEGGNPFDAFSDYRVNLFDPSDNFLIVDMKTDADSSHEFIPKTPNETREVLIIFTKEINDAPVARGDSAVTFKGTDVDIDVLSNDVDVKNTGISIVEPLPNNSQSAQGATLEIVDSQNENGQPIKKIRYKPGDITENTDSFTYLITDGTETSLPATVNIIIDDLVFTRTHDSNLLSGENLTVSIQVSYSDVVSGSVIKLKEGLPRFDDALGFYTIPTINEAGDLDVSGDGMPDTVDVNGTEVTFTWDPEDDTPLPASPFTFQYKIAGNTTTSDVVEKCITGVISRGEIQGPEIETCFTPNSNLFHKADYKGAEGNADSKIDAEELFDVIVLFNAGEYHINPSENSGYGPGAGNQSGIPHSADYKGAESGADFKIDPDELFDVIVLFNAGCYVVDANENSGFGPGIECE